MNRFIKNGENEKTDKTILRIEPALTIRICKDEESSWDTIWKWTWHSRREWMKNAWREKREALSPALEFLSGTGVKTILDCTCGLGYTAVLLAKEGYITHGSDASSAVEYAPVLAKEKGMKLRFFRSRWEELQRKVPARYDCIISDYFDEAPTISCIRNSARAIHSVLNEGGIFIFGAMNPRITDLKKLVEQEWKNKSGTGSYPVSRHEGLEVNALEITAKENNGISDTRIFLVRGKEGLAIEVAKIMNPRIVFDFRTYSAALRETGFRKITSVNDKGRFLNIAFK